MRSVQTLALYTQSSNTLREWSILLRNALIYAGWQEKGGRGEEVDTLEEQQSWRLVFCWLGWVPEVKWEKVPGIIDHSVCTSKKQYQCDIVCNEQTGNGVCY